MSTAVGASEVVGGWLLSRAADLGICLLLTFAFALFDARLPELRDATMGLLVFGIVYFGAGFVLTSFVWWWVSLRSLALSPTVFALSSAALLAVTLTGIHVCGGGWARADWLVLLNPILVGGIALHALSTWSIRKYMR